MSGLSRSTLNALVLGPNPPVESVCLRRRGAAKGIRLIVAQSLRDYLYANIDRRVSPVGEERIKRPLSLTGDMDADAKAVASSN